ncbi:MAG: PIN domain-containing protein [Anaerolineae bacterium]|nr:PIN domain-containing protein [Anaerolineae bacterium]
MNAEGGLQFVDTNVLVYAHDASAGDRHARARRLIEHLWQARQGCLSTQVLQEFCVVSTRKGPRPLDHEKVARIIAQLSQWRVHRPSVDSILSAMRVQARYRISFWDALIIQSALELGCTTIWSEDLNRGQAFETVTVANPFLP